jgi:hypothetical protein
MPGAVDVRRFWHRNCGAKMDLRTVVLLHLESRAAGGDGRLAAVENAFAVHWVRVCIRQTTVVAERTGRARYSILGGSGDWVVGGGDGL